MIPPASHNSLVLRRTFKAPPIRVFRAWTEPEALASWFRPKGMRVTISKLDVRVGGSFHFDLIDGGTIFGTYLRIVPSEQLVFTWAGTAMQEQETLVTVDFLDQGAMTEVVLTHEGLNTPDLLTLFGSGWPSLLDALTSLLSLHPTDDPLGL